MPGSCVVHESRHLSGADEVLSELIGRADVNRKAAFVHLLQVRHWTVRFMMSRVVKIARYVRTQLLLDGFKDFSSI